MKEENEEDEKRKKNGEFCLCAVLVRGVSVLSQGGSYTRL